MNKAEVGRWYVLSLPMSSYSRLVDYARSPRDSTIACGGTLNLENNKEQKLSSAAKKETARDIMLTRPVSLLVQNI